MPENGRGWTPYATQSRASAVGRVSSMLSPAISHTDNIGVSSEENHSLSKGGLGPWARVEKTPARAIPAQRPGPGLAVSGPNRVISGVHCVSVNTV